jgi:hypothetical protein
VGADQYEGVFVQSLTSRMDGLFDRFAPATSLNQLDD